MELRVCCGADGNRKCMYFDIGSENRQGQYGGPDRWFPPDHRGFGHDIDPTTLGNPMKN